MSYFCYYLQKSNSSLLSTLQLTHFFLSQMPFTFSLKRFVYQYLRVKSSSFTFSSPIQSDNILTLYVSIIVELTFQSN